MVEQQLWDTGAPADQDSSSSGSNGINSLVAEAADDKGLAAWELNMKALKTAAYDLGRLPNEVRSPEQVLHGCRFARQRRFFQQLQSPWVATKHLQQGAPTALPK